MPALVIWSSESGRLSATTGLDCELYCVLLVGACVRALLQAVAASEQAMRAICQCNVMWHDVI